MADFSSRFAVAITADDQTAAGSDKASRTMTDALSKPAGAAKLASSETAKAFDKGINRPLDQAKKKTDAADKAVRSLKDRIAARWHTGGAGKAFDSIGAARMATGDLAGRLGSMFTPAAGLTALFSGAGAMDLMSGFGSRANQLSRTSSRYGVDPGMLQQWQGAAKQKGLDPNAVGSSLGALTGHMYDFQKKLPAANGVFQMAMAVQRRTGVDLIAALGKDQNTFLKTLARAMPKLDPGAQAKVVSTFGVEALWDLLRNPAQLDQFIDSVKRLGTLTKEQIDQGDALYTSFKTAEEATGHFADTIESQLAPSFKPALDGYTHWIEELSKSPHAVDMVTSGAAALTAVFGLTLVTAIGKAAKALINFNGVWLKRPFGTAAIGAFLDYKQTSHNLDRAKNIDPQHRDPPWWAYLPGGEEFWETRVLLDARHSEKSPGAPPRQSLWNRAIGEGAAQNKSPDFTPASDRHRNFDSAGRPIVPFEPVTPKVMSPHSEATPSAAPALSQSSASAFAPSNAYAPPMSEIDVAKYFEGQGWTPARARGITAGAYAESKLDPNAVNPKSGAYGIGQWLGPRQKELFRQFGPQPTMSQQLAFLDLELKGGDRGGYAVQSATTDTAAMDAYIRRFMRPKAGAETDDDLRRGNDVLSTLRDDSEFAGSADAEPRGQKANARDTQSAPAPRRPMPDDLASADLDQETPASYRATSASDIRQEIVIIAPPGTRAELRKKEGPIKVALRVQRSFEAA